MRLFLIFFSFFLTACTNTELRLQDFIPESKLQIEQNISSQNTEFPYISTNFPDNCDWKSLKRVVDGDTIIVDKNTRVRLIGIDTPETKRENYPVQPYGLEASKFTNDALSQELKYKSKKVCLIEDSIGDKYDQYGRRLSYVFTSEGKDLNGAILKSGLARGYFRFPFDRKEEFRAYEREAKAQKVNIWEK